MESPVNQPQNAVFSVENPVGNVEKSGFTKKLSTVKNANKSRQRGTKMEKIDNVKSVFKKKEDALKNTVGVSPAVIRRLPRYHRYLGELLRKDILRVSSGELVLSSANAAI